MTGDRRGNSACRGDRADWGFENVAYEFPSCPTSSRRAQHIALGGVFAWANTTKHHLNQPHKPQKYLDQHHDEHEKSEKMRADLLYAENHPIEVEKRVEVVPEDYNRLKMEQQELLDAAARAEERANEAEAELERLQMEGNGTAKPEKPVGIVLNEAVNVFLSSCDMMTFDPVSLQRDVFAVKHGLQNLQEWIDRMQAALEMPVITEAGVV